MANMPATNHPPEAPVLHTRRLLGVKQVAERLGISRSTIYELYRAGDLSYLKIGERRLTEESEVDAFIEKVKANTKNPHKDNSNGGSK
jgi:excisionase family DNA binding protein